MKLMMSGDHHFDETRRFDEAVRIHEHIAAEVRERKPDVFLSGGDIYERASTPNERLAVCDWLRAVAEVCPVVIVRGNHDRSRDLEILRRLQTKHPIHVEERCGVVSLPGGDIVCIAWPSKASLAAMLSHQFGRPVVGQELEQSAGDALRTVLSYFSQRNDPGRPRILLMHAMVNGSLTSAGQPLIGSELSIGLEDLAIARADLTLLSHIHRAQEWRGVGGGDVVYAGSPFRTSFGEIEEKSVVYAEVSQGLAKWERLPTPARQMLLFDGGVWDPAEDAIVWPEEGMGMTRELVHNAEIRIRYTLDADQREAAKCWERQMLDGLLANGAALVKFEPKVNVNVRSRMPELAKASSLDEKLAAYWAAKGTTPEPERAARLLSKLQQLRDERAQQRGA